MLSIFHSVGEGRGRGIAPFPNIASVLKQIETCVFAKPRIRQIIWILFKRAAVNLWSKQFFFALKKYFAKFFSVSIFRDQQNVILYCVIQFFYEKLVMPFLNQTMTGIFCLFFVFTIKNNLFQSKLKVLFFMFQKANAF